MSDFEFFPSMSERSLILGQTGSGKTQFSVWLIKKLNRKTVIYDTKIDSTFDNFYICDNINKLKYVLEHKSIVVYRPSIEELTDNDKMDSILTNHYNNLNGIQCYIDEIYQFHDNGRAGNGLVGLLTRGRSKNISVIMSTQRPSWLSRFCLTESQLFYIFNLTDRKDYVRLSDIIPNFKKLSEKQKYSFEFYRHGMESPVIFNPIPYKKSGIKESNKIWL